MHYTVNIPSKRGALNNGLKYPPAALYQLLSGSNRHMWAVDRYVLKIMNHILEFKEHNRCYGWFIPPVENVGYLCQGETHT